AAQMFYNLLLDKDVAGTASFTDVSADAWYAEAVNTLASLGMIQGVEGNRFQPDRAITRAEFTAIAMRFTNGETTGENRFSDVNPDQWFYDVVVGAVQYGWINGYEDGTFRPESTIKRAEVAAITNRMLARSADEAYVDAHASQLRLFADVAKDHWAYYTIVEASNTHDYQTNHGNETWKDA
ncbi:MAG: S-layer homology domain-containing protein, partial [Clostridiales bacterium]|nr:S-layer homology domain-containing protein [Clostridiales bacterium]